MREDLPFEEITLEDVRIALKILRAWLEQHRELERMLARYAPRRTGATRVEDMIFQALLGGAATSAAAAATEAETEAALSEEERKRWEELKKRVKEKYSQ